MFEYEVISSPTGEDEIRITKCLANEGRIEIPPVLQGKAVTQIGPYAFAKTHIRSLALPGTVTWMGNYALYLCAGLEEFHFYDTLKDIGSGAFTGCHHIQRLRIEFTKGEQSALRDVLMEIPEELTVEYCTGPQTAHLIFPEYYEEGVENTPARIIEHHTHGSGLFYRNCFVSRVLSFGEYDGRFPYALGQEREELLIRMAAGRLRFPYQLTDSARRTYQNWLMEHFEAALDYYTRQKDQGMTAYLMEQRRGKAGKKRAAFEL